MLANPEFFEGHHRSPAMAKMEQGRIPVIVAQWGAHNTITAHPAGQPEPFPNRGDRQPLHCLVKRGIVHTGSKLL
jgi:hypothetical protein